MNISRKAILLGAILLGCLGELSAQVRQTREEYVDRYMHIAVAHMERYGIPASITLAQGILESDCGNSLLAMKSNNHFGIKCKTNWKGAVLNYERALLMNPGDADIRFNLEMARSKTVDQVTPTSEVFIVTWVKSLTNCMSESGWGVTAIIAFLLLLAGLALYIFGNRIVFKKIGFIAAIIFLVVAVCANFFASEQKDKLLNRTGAIVMSPSITVKSTPNESGTDLFVLHEGTKVYIEDNSMKGWKEIRLEDGKKGWLPVSAIEVI